MFEFIHYIVNLFLHDKIPPNYVKYRVNISTDYNCIRRSQDFVGIVSENIEIVYLKKKRFGEYILYFNGGNEAKSKILNIVKLNKYIDVYKIC